MKGKAGEVILKRQAWVGCQDMAICCQDRAKLSGQGNEGKAVRRGQCCQGNA